MFDTPSCVRLHHATTGYDALGIRHATCIRHVTVLTTLYVGNATLRRTCRGYVTPRWIPCYVGYATLRWLRHASWGTPRYGLTLYKWHFVCGNRCFFHRTNQRDSTPFRQSRKAHWREGFNLRGVHANSHCIWRRPCCFAASVEPRVGALRWIHHAKLDPS